MTNLLFVYPQVKKTINPLGAMCLFLRTVLPPTVSFCVLSEYAEFHFVHLVSMLNLILHTRQLCLKLDPARGQELAVSLKHHYILQKVDCV
jgi:hypothetical protein